MTRIALLLILSFFLSVSIADDSRKMLNHVTLVVSDLEVSEAFYKGVLNLEQIDTPWWSDDDPYMFLALGENLELHIGEIEGIEIKPNGYNHFAIAVDDFDGFLEHLKAAGIVYSNLGGGTDYYVGDRPDGVRQTWITDPDGYWIEINDADR